MLEHKDKCRNYSLPKIPVEDQRAVLWMWRITATTDADVLGMQDQKPPKNMAKTEAAKSWLAFLQLTIKAKRSAD